MVATTDLSEAVHGADAVLVAIPSEFVARTFKSLPGLQEGTVLVSATKGFDPERHLRMSELIGERFPEAGVAVLSGPTFAREVVGGQPTAAVVASADEGWPPGCAMRGARASSGSTPTATWPAWRSAAP